MVKVCLSVLLHPELIYVFGKILNLKSSLYFYCLELISKIVKRPIGGYIKFFLPAKLIRILSFIEIPLSLI